MDVTDITIKLSTQAAEVALAGQGLPGAGRLVETLIRNLLEVQDEQKKLMRRIDRSVRNLAEAPWHTAHLHLRECLLPGRTTEQIAESRRLAANYLREAVGVGQGFSSVYAAFDLAILLASLDDAEGSRLYARESVASATEIVMELYKQKKPMWKRSLEKEFVGQLVLARFEKPRQEYREWSVLTISLESICGTDFLLQEKTRMPPLIGIEFSKAWHAEPTLTEIPKPEWIPSLR